MSSTAGSGVAREFTDAAAQYRYFTTNLLTNQVLAEIPFKDVSFGRSIKTAGPFSGSIAVIPETASMDIYNSTMPGKTAIYIVRDNVCVYGGIIWSRDYDVVERKLNVHASEFTSYFHHRNIWKTWSHDFGADLTVSGGVISATLQGLTYDFPVGSSIKLVFPTTDMFTYNGYYTVATSVDDTHFTVTGTTLPNGTYPDVTVYARVDTYDYVRQLIDEVLVDFSGVAFPNTDIEPALGSAIQIISKAVSGNVATIVTATPHDIIPTQTVELYNVDSTFNGLFDVTSTPTSTSFTFALTAANTGPTTLTANTRNVITKSISNFVGTLTTSSAHGFLPGDIVSISGVDGSSRTITSKKILSNVATIKTSSAHGANIGDSVKVSGVGSPFDGVFYIDAIDTTDSFSYAVTNADITETSATGTAVFAGFFDVFNGTHTIVTTPTTTTFTVDLSDTDMVDTTVTGTAVVSPTVKVGTYGPFPGNSDIDIAYSTEAYSGKNIPNTNYRGFELRNVGEELDAYSDTVKGFEYRVDCDLVYVGDLVAFARTFVLIPIDFPNPPAAGQASPPSRFGADQLVFEYPGSIINTTMEENAENAATRFFVVGNISDLGDNASQPYAVASATDLLRAGWPLLDQEETRNEVQDETLLQLHAERYLAESRPPISDIKVTVNGSLAPRVGEYAPGDWCSIIINDEFVRMRLASDLEPRDTVIVRKIDGYNVRVPNSPSFPEEVELILVTEPAVDAIG